MGTRVVLEAARIDPERVAGLVLIDGSRQGSGNPDEAEAAMEAAIRAVGFPAFRENAFRQMFFQWSPQAEALLERSKRLAPDAGRALWTRMVRWDAEHMDAALAAVRCPLMVIQATFVNAQRKRVPLGPGQTTPYLELIKDKIAHARLEVLPGRRPFRPDRGRGGGQSPRERLHRAVCNGGPQGTRIGCGSARCAGRKEQPKGVPS